MFTIGKNYYYRNIKIKNNLKKKKEIKNMRIEKMTNIEKMTKIKSKRLKVQRFQLQTKIKIKMLSMYINQKRK